jgi:diguanylate cyclase (GGDEF)-like protein
MNRPAAEPARARFDPQQQRRRLLGWLTVILSLTFAAASGLAYWVASGEVRRGIVERELPLTSESIYSEIQRDILRPVFVSAQMAQNTWLRDWVEAGERDVEPLLRYLREVKANNAAVTSFYVSAQTRRYYHPSGAEKTVSERDPGDAWFFRVLKMKDTYEISADPDAMNQLLLTLFINYKMLSKDGKLLGVTGVGLSSENLVKLVKEYERRFSRRISLLDEEGSVVLTSDSQTTLPGKTRITPKLSQLQGLRDLEPQILNRDPSQTRLSYVSEHGTTTFVNSRFVPELRWYVLVEQDETQALAPVRRVLWWSALIGLAALLLTITVVNTVVGRFQRRLELMASTDELSQLPNRRSGENALDSALQAARSGGQPLGLLVVDVDHFKRVNDTHGHAVGDRVIAEVARLAQQAVRPSDLVARWGGEEFVVVLRNSDPASTAKVAQRVCDTVAQARIDVPGQALAATVSVGAAQWAAGESGAGFFARADAALLRAKQAGRNRVVCNAEGFAAGDRLRVSPPLLPSPHALE